MLKDYAFLPPSGSVNDDVDRAICFDLVGCKTRHKVIVVGGSVRSFEAPGVVVDMDVTAGTRDFTVKDLVADGLVHREA